MTQRYKWSYPMMVHLSQSGVVIAIWYMSYNQKSALMQNKGKTLLHLNFVAYEIYWARSTHIPTRPSASWGHELI